MRKIKRYHAKKREESKEETPVASTSKPQANQFPQERKKNKKEEMEENILPKLQDPKNPKRCHGKLFQHGQNLDGIQGKRGTKNKKTSFPKELTLSLDFVNTLKEIKNSILPFKDIKNSLLSLK
ncbi:hypothetical protein O181_116189 [Austropuccinia psidii MF-1]|uniref:Uncharacterized protein n=1 Tax=Austropuccinia psidii MF-1 TaxID=1389203 RepID=A0A9Q3KB12_9BASI|nr:hypothetical protein [Austropuccinia psidii MF-1]